MTKSNKLYLILFIIGAALIAYSIIPLLLAKNTNRIPGLGIDEFADTVGTQVSEAYVPSGKLLMTLKPKNSFDKRIEGYAFDMATGKLSKVDGADASSSYHTTSHNRAYGALVGTTITHLTESNNEPNDAYQVYRTVLGTGQSVPSLASSTAITNTTHKSKRLPSINNNGDILYAAIAEESDISAGDIGSIGEWAVYLVANNANSTSTPLFISNGLYPKWVSDSTFVYAKDDGIYLQSKNAHNKKASRIISFDYSALSNMKMHVSKSGKLLAWTMPDAGKVQVYNISNTSAVKLVHSFAVHAFWPAFSPSDEYIAVQAIDWANIKDNPKPRIEVYSLRDFSLQYSVSIDSFVQTAMFLNDWVE